MSRSKAKFKSDPAADKALKRTTLCLVDQLNLFETTLHLQSMDALTRVEAEKLGNSFITESERKQYLLTTVIPSKGYYRGMKLLKRALKQSNQFEIVNTLEKAYEVAVDAVLAERLKLSEKPPEEVNHETGASYPVQVTASGSITSESLSESFLDKDSGNDLRKSRKFNRPTSPDSSKDSSSSSNDDEDDVISLDSPVQQQPLPSHVDITLHLPASTGSTATVSVASSPHRPRADHISYKSHPYKCKVKQQEQAVSVTVNLLPENSNKEEEDVDHGRVESIVNVR